MVTNSERTVGLQVHILACYLVILLRCIKRRFYVACIVVTNNTGKNVGGKVGEKLGGKI